MAMGTIFTKILIEIGDLWSYGCPLFWLQLMFSFLFSWCVWDASFWKSGDLASVGLREVAEVGTTRTLESELKDKVSE